MSIIEKMNHIPVEDMAMSIVTIAELQFGAYNSGKIQRNLERIQYLKNIIQTINLSTTITEEYAKIKSKLRKTGNPIDDFDILIGATAIVNSLTLITNNEQHFNRIENISIENWT
jgi:tRNA(fMet)-specific endonuclease VapC